MKAYTGNAADIEQVKEAASKEKRGKEQRCDDMLMVLSTPQGRRFIWRYLTECGVFRTSYTGDATNTIYLEGQRNMGLKILSDVNEASPEAYIKMMLESKEFPNA